MNPKEAILWTDEKLLSEISLGNEYAFRIIFDRYRKKVYCYALKIIKSEVQAEEIVFEVFLKIWKNEQAVKIKCLDAFLSTVTRNYTLNALRKKQLEEKVNVQHCKGWKEGHNETEEAIFLKDSEEILKQAIERLPPQQKIVFTLCRQEGLRYEEVAERLTISRLTVKTHMQHALRFLRKQVSMHDVITVITLLTALTEEK